MRKTEMGSEDKPFDDTPFIECANVFAQHDYDRAANIALNLLPKRMFLWVMQVMLISLERSGDYHNFETMTKNFAKPHING